MRYGCTWRGILPRLSFPAVLLCLCAGCSYHELAMRPYAPIPPSCEAIAAEMREVSDRLGTTWALRDAKGLMQVGLNLAVATGTIEPGFAAFNILLQGIHLKDDADQRRLQFLANAYEHRKCWENPAP